MLKAEIRGVSLPGIFRNRKPPSQGLEGPSTDLAGRLGPKCKDGPSNSNFRLTKETKSPAAVGWVGASERVEKSCLSQRASSPPLQRRSSYPWLHTKLPTSESLSPAQPPGNAL